MGTAASLTLPVVKFLRRLALLSVLVGLGACSSGKIALEYRFDQGEGTRYLWTIDSETSINSSTEQSVTTIRMLVDVHEQTSREEDGSDPILTITLTPRNVEQSGRVMPTPEAVTVRYALGPQGEILRPLDNDDLAPQAASAIELASTLIRSRIALPADPVGIDDQWDAPVLLDGDLGNIDLQGQGRLVGFELKGKRKLARIETVRSGEIITHEQQGGVVVRLRGTTNSDSLSSLDIDNGILYGSSERFVSDFDIAALESGKLMGNMRVVLNSTLELQPA